MSIEISIILPTYGREQVLIDTLNYVLELVNDQCEVVVVDQTPEHEPNVKSALQEWHNNQAVNWIQQSPPSIPQAMNRAALNARGKVLLYLDDDIIPDSGLIAAHLMANERHCGDLIAGRVLQPWHTDTDSSHPFTSMEPGLKEEFMGGNFSIARSLVLEQGGFDENFKGGAHNFEREFADRLLLSGHTIWYDPSAQIRHLHYKTGGTRSKGNHLTSWNPNRSVGIYYYLFTSSRVNWKFFRTVKRLFRSVTTRHHLKAPWYIPVTLVSEIRGMFWAFWLWRKGPSLPFLDSSSKDKL